MCERARFPDLIFDGRIHDISLPWLHRIFFLARPLARRTELPRQTAVVAVVFAPHPGPRSQPNGLAVRGGRQGAGAPVEGQGPNPLPAAGAEQDPGSARPATNHAMGDMAPAVLGDDGDGTNQCQQPTIGFELLLGTPDVVRRIMLLLPRRDLAALGAPFIPLCGF